MAKFKGLKWKKHRIIIKCFIQKYSETCLFQIAKGDKLRVRTDKLSIFTVQNVKKNQCLDDTVKQITKVLDITQVII